MNISAKVVLKSVNKTTGDEIATFLLEYPRIILPEMLTHRLFVRNTASSRAVPVKTMLNRVKTNPFIPEKFGKNKSGMAASENLTGAKLGAATTIWNNALARALDFSEQLSEIGVHKQLANRVTEPYQNIQQLVTATQLNNFFKLRIDKAAQPEIHELAEKMKAAYSEAPTQRLEPGEWHTPFIRPEEFYLSLTHKLLVSTARCARVSYYLHDGKISDLYSDLDLAKRLISSSHMSPTEHVAMAMNMRAMAANFVGWIQLRKFIQNEDNGDIPDVMILNNRQINDYFGNYFDYQEFTNEID